MNLRAVRFLLACICLLVGLALAAPAVVALCYRETHDAVGFVLAALVAFITGGFLWSSARGALHSRDGRPTFFRREGIAVAGIGWILASALGALPFLTCGASSSAIDAFFESVSGFTTTGSSIFTAEAIDGLSHGIQFWRCFSQWIGGVGIVVVFVVFLPAGGRSLFRSEGIERKADEARVRDGALVLLLTYALLTAAGTALLWVAGMSPFDALAHSFSCISTGGFSIRGASVAYYHSSLIEFFCIVLMIAGGMNFALWTTFVRKGPLQGFQWAARSSELRLYLGLLGAFFLSLTLVLWFWGGSNGLPGTDLPDYSSFLLAARDSAFSLVSVQTTTGLATADFDRWPDVCRLLLMTAAIIGSCTNSTGGGIKVMRLIVAARGASASVHSYSRPRALVSVQLDGTVLEEDSVAMVARYLVLYALTAVAAVLLLALFGSTPTEAISGVIACLNTMGPGLGGVGPSQCFGHLAGASKLVLSALMILGRLEFFAVVALFLPGFWRR